MRTRKSRRDTGTAAVLFVCNLNLTAWTLLLGTGGMAMGFQAFSRRRAHVLYDLFTKLDRARGSYYLRAVEYYQ